MQRQALGLDGAECCRKLRLGGGGDLENRYELAGFIFLHIMSLPRGHTLPTMNLHLCLG